MNLLFIIFNILIPITISTCNDNIAVYNESCPSSFSIPDCNYMSSNLDTICGTIATGWEILNGNDCHIKGTNYGCNFLDGTNSSSDKVMCCSQSTISSTSSPSISASAINSALLVLDVSNNSTNSMVISVESSGISTKTSSPTSTCAYRTYNTASDFSGTQGKNGWYYGYYSSGVFTQFTHYQTTSYTSSLAWNYNPNSYGYISSNIMMPNGAATCGTTSYGNIAPVLRWYNPMGACYQDVTIYFSISPSTANVISLKANGNTLYSSSAHVSYNNYFNVYSMFSLELSVGPLNGNCDAGQTTYSLIISAMGSSNTVIPSKSVSVSSSFSPSPRFSAYSSNTIINTNSIVKSISNTASASASATVFYLGNWTDLGQNNYAMADIPPAPLVDLTIAKCQLYCWVNPLCGLIVVETPCTTISLDDPEVNTVVCSKCWLKLTSGWIVSADDTSKTIMLYDRVYPPTTTSIVSKTTTASIKPTDSIVNSKSTSRSPLASYSSLKSYTISSSSSQSKTSTVSIESTDSLRNSKTNTATASSSATVFYTGNWTDYGDVYFTGQVGVTGSTTIHQCMIACWLNPLCGGISVNWACSNIRLDSSQIYTFLCENCRLIPKSTEMDTYPGTFNQHAEWKSFIIYDKIFPPTTSVISSKTSTISAIPTSSLVMYSSYNMCTNNGKTIILPFPGSYTILRTNELGNQYTNNMNCDMTIAGGNARQAFQINFTSFNTEQCCDFFKIYDSSGAQVFSNAGTTIPNSFFISSTSIRLQMTTDGSVVSSGVIVQVYLLLLSASPSTSTSNSPRESRTSSRSGLLSNSGYPSNTMTSSQSLSKTSTSSVSNSNSAYGSITNTPNPSFSKSVRETYSSKFTNTDSSKTTNYQTLSGSTSMSSTAINSYTATSSASVSNSPSVSQTSSKSNSKSGLLSKSITQTITSSLSWSIKPTLSVSPTYSSSISPSQFIKLSNNEIGARLVNSFIGNKTSLSLNETKKIFHSVKHLPADQIKNLLRTAGVLTLGGNPDVPFQVTTDTFSFHAQIIPPNPINVSTSNLKLNIPNLNISGSAVSIITWNENPFQVGQKLDTNVLSVSVSKLTGQEVSINNLTEPLQFKYKLNLDPTDSRIDIATYKINCFDNLNYKITASGPSFINLAKNNSNYIIPCYDKNYSIGCALNDTLITFNCPKPELKAKCMYWNTSLEMWDDQGCSVVSVSSSELICNCSHLTDFGSRFEAVYKSNKEIFADAGSVYSLEGLEKYKQFYITFGALAIFGFITFGIGLYLDIISANKYYQSLIRIPVIKELKQKTGCLIDICYEYSVSFSENKYDNNKIYEDVEENKIENEIENENKNSRYNTFKRFVSIWWNRLLFQHSHLSAFLRFDPRMPRLFRLLIIFVAQFNSLFLTAFLYAFKYGDETVGADVETITLVEIITLAAITAALNTPCMTILIRMTNLAGIAEFKWRYPILYDELIRRHDFENELLLFTNEELDVRKLNVIKFKQNRISNRSKINKNQEDNNNHNHNNLGAGGDTEDGIINWIFSYLCFKKKKDILKDKGTIENAYQIATKPYPKTIKQAAYYSYFPFHTRIGGLIFCVSIGWFIWCLNYLLLFAAHHHSSVSTKMLTSFGISEITTVFITQPIVLFCVMLITYGINIILKKLKCNKKDIKIPSIYYFSDPFIKPYSTILSTSFAYNVFLNSPANLINLVTNDKSVPKNLGYAPLNGIIESIESNEIDKITIDERHEKIVELYELLKDDKKLNKLTNVIYINDLEEYKSYDYKHNSILIKEITNSDFHFFKVNKTVKK
jgi:hypothetical protein